MAVMPRGMVVGLASFALALSTPAAAAQRSPDPGPPEVGAEQPNLVLITTDDQPSSSFRRAYMPATFGALVERGTSFTDAVVNSPLCCPSRSTILTGQYPHNHGVLSNAPGYGSLADKRNVLPVWLRRAGYRTAHFGKWLHGYRRVAGRRPAPGWDRWYTQHRRDRYYDYKIAVGKGPLVQKGVAPEDHVTAAVARAASRFVRRKADNLEPLYLQLDLFAPHAGPETVPSGCSGTAQPEQRDLGRFSRSLAPRVPSFNEAEIDDKPAFAQLPTLDAEAIEALDIRYRCILQSLAGADRAIKSVIREFRLAGEMSNTAFVFLTDNGFLSGEHRVRAGKARPFEEVVRTPLVLRLPSSVGAGRPVVPAPVGALDIAPTLLELAGAQPCNRRGCRVLDGRSLLGLATGAAAERPDRAILVEMAEPQGEQARERACAFQALRTRTDVLVENTRVPDPVSGLCRDEVLYEHYDRIEDPFQLDNLLPPDRGLPGPRQVELLSRLGAIRACSGVEGRDPLTAGGWCE